MAATAPTQQDPSPRHATSFLEAQRVAAMRVGFTVTQACPLRCAHCSVEAAPDLARTTFGESFAHRIAEQMPDLRAIGIRFIDFTGGEPVLARKFVSIVSKAAAQAGMTCGIVTAAHWARTPEQARKTIDSFPFIENWDISTDIYHLPFVAAGQVETAFHTLRDHGRSTQIRVAHHEEITESDARLIDRVFRFAGRRIAFQPIGPVGRGKNLVTAPPVSAEDRDQSPCASTGLLIHNDGAGAPCCAPISHTTRDSPLFIGNARRDALCDMVARWRVQPLIQTIRVWGFAPLDTWLRTLDADPAAFYRRHTCDQCVAMLADPARVRLLDRMANRLEHRIDLAVALLRDFQEPWLDQQLQQEATRYLAGETTVWPAPADTAPNTAPLAPQPA